MFSTTPSSPFSSRHPSMDGVPLQFERRGSVRTGPAEDSGEMRLCIEKLKVEREKSILGENSVRIIRERCDRAQHCSTPVISDLLVVSMNRSKLAKKLLRKWHRNPILKKVPLCNCILETFYTTFACGVVVSMDFWHDFLFLSWVLGSAPPY